MTHGVWLRRLDIGRPGRASAAAGKAKTPSSGSLPNGTSLLEAFGVMQNNLNFTHSEMTESDLHNNQNSDAVLSLTVDCPRSPPPQASSKRERDPVVSTTKRGLRRQGQPMRPCRATPSNAADVEALEITVLRSMVLDQAQPLGVGVGLGRRVIHHPEETITRGAEDHHTGP